MKHILVLGATGHLGTVFVRHCLEKKYHVTALVRNPEKLSIASDNLTLLKGDVTNNDDLSQALVGIDAVVSLLGHGFRTVYPIQEKTARALFPLMEQKKITRFITVTGAGLKVAGDPPSIIGDLSNMLFSLIDPPRMSDVKNQQLLLEKTHLDWTVVRTPIHNNKDIILPIHSDFTQPKPWQTISRKTICEFIVTCIEKNTFSKQSPIIY